jgi:hypothetical protein
MNKEYWESFYEKKWKFKASQFAQWVRPFIQGDLVDIGCGNGRDVHYFLECGLKAGGIDSAYENDYIIKTDVNDYMKRAESPRNVYARFFWHAIDRKTQLAILKWAKHFIFIEARTTDDKFKPKVFDKHERNFVDVSQLVKDLKANGFRIVRLEEGTGFSKYKGEDPFLVRVVAKKL